MAAEAEEFKKLSAKHAIPEFQKIIQDFFTCPVCTNVIEDIVQCSECEESFCKLC